MGSNNIEQHSSVQPQTAAQNSETIAEPTVAVPESSGSANGSENGGVYFELNWETGQAQYRQQQLLTTYPNYSQETPTENSGYNPNGNNYGNGNGFGNGNNFGANSYSGNYGGNSYSPEYNGGQHFNFGDSGYDYDENSHGNFPYVYGDNSTNPTDYLFGSNETNPLYNSENPISWNDFLDLISNYPEFSDYQTESNEFWRDLQRFSDSTIFQDENFDETPFLEANDFDLRRLFQTNDDVETESFSRYDELLSEFKSREIPLDEFVETLPPEEKEFFQTRYQIDEILGENPFKPDGVTLTETVQVRIIESAIANDQIEFLPENVQREIREGKTFAVGEDGRIIVIPRQAESSESDAEIPIPNGETFAPNRLVSEKIEAGELRPTDKSSQIAVGQSNAVVLTDNGTSRAVNHNTVDNSSSISSISRRDGGTILGGALISGSFSSIENFKNAESNGVGNPSSIESNNFSGRNSFAAGATGAMMSAAIGSLVPSSDAVISGVVGFISGVVIGVEADQGLRWLSGDRPTAIASTGNVNLLEENSFALV